ncbi:hypothetical protein DFQ28_001972 [Apophysomyces sp. BC1034]|nr:hypothetical protein DFQ30_002377 [Apophysomyces sp. BC1015]KAG0179911.1 hypothetical protein DFQ29_001491 [Apophysomyces sp. BC1021]KAG0190499.1 hypothetical protein DFQ28_001972 [Apophysomyces sp. BC1034]
MSENQHEQESSRPTDEGSLGRSTRPFVNKFATIPNDKYPQNLRRDLLLSNFDRNLTIEKAHFEPQPLHTPDTMSDDPGDTLLSQSPPRATSIKTEPRRKKKRPSTTAATTTTSPAEVFHRNLVDAVSNVEDSDENERYVYPYTADHDLYRPVSLRSNPIVDPERRRSRHRFMDLFRPSSQDEVHSRPKIRNNVARLTYDGSSRRNKRPPSPATYGDGYLSDDEEDPLLGATPYNRRRHYQYNHYRRAPPPRRSRSWAFGLCLCLIGIILFLLIGIYQARPLTDVSVQIDRVLASDKELIFDLHVQATNPNLWTVLMTDADISLFAFSQIVPPLQSSAAANPAEFLGSFYHFDEPLSIPSAFFSNSAEQVAISQIRLRVPGADQRGNERWSRIIRYPYGLVARGVLKYRKIPLFWVGFQSTVICDVAQVDPTTGNVSEDPDQEYCDDDENNGKRLWSI